MKKLLLVFGAILIITGILLMSTSNAVEEKSKLETLDYAVNSWKVSASVSKGDRIFVDFTPAIWKRHELPDDNHPYPYKFVRIEIVSPKNETTTFDVTLMWSPGAIVPGVTNITLVEQDGVNVMEPIQTVGGIATYDGEYTARIPEYGVWPPEKDPPTWLAIRKEVIEKECPFSFLLPVGAAFSVVGAGVTLFGAMISRRRTSVDKRRKSKFR